MSYNAVVELVGDQLPYLRWEYTDPTGAKWLVVGIHQTNRHQYDVDIGSPLEEEREWRPVGRTDRVRVLRFASDEKRPIPNSDEGADEQFMRAQPVGRPHAFSDRGVLIP